MASVHWSARLAVLSLSSLSFLLYCLRTAPVSSPIAVNLNVSGAFNSQANKHLQFIACIFGSIRPTLIPSADDRVSSNVDGLNSNTPPARRRPARTDEATMDVIKTMINQLSAGDWRVRYDAINTFLEMCVERPDTISTHIVMVRRPYPLEPKRNYCKISRGETSRSKHIVKERLGVEISDVHPC